MVLAQGNACQYLRPPTASSWLIALGVRGLASPHPILGAIRVVDKGGMYKAGVAGLFHFVLSTFRLVPGPDAWRHGRFGREGQLCSVLVLLVAIRRDQCSLPLTDRPKTLGIMAGTNQKYSYVGVWLVCW